MKQYVVVALLSLSLAGCGNEVNHGFVVSDYPSPSPTQVKPLGGTTNWEPTPPVQPSKRASRSRSRGGLQGMIADCESGDRLASGRAVPGSRRYHTVHYPSGRSSASGAYGFLDGTWQAVTGRSDRAYQASESDQDAAFRKLYRTSGTKPWEASRSCWG